MDTLGSRLRYLRELAGLSPGEVGQRAGLGNPAPHIRMIEEGRRPHIAATTATALARVFDAEVEWLVDGRGPALRGAPFLVPADPEHTPAIKAALLAALDRAARPEAA